MLRKSLLIITLLVHICAFGQRKTLTITAYGAKGDGQTNSTAAIQKAIEEVSRQGGGRVIVPAGKFVTGPLVLKSGVELHLVKGATLLGSTRRLDYGTVAASLVTAQNQQNVAITGQGTIDGRGRELVQDLLVQLRAGVLDDPEWKAKRPTEKNRPQLLMLTGCRQVRVTGVTLKDAACWVQAYRECTDVVVDSIRVESTAYWNNDGIDFVDCKNVKLSNSFFNAADDGICLKSENPKASCDNITVTNCTVRSSASAFKLGTGSLGGFRNITVRGLTVYDTFRSAIALETVDGAFLEDIDIQNVTAKNTGNAIFLRLGHRKGEAPGTLRRVYIGNVKVQVPAGKPDKGYEIEGPVFKEPHNVNPSSITGLPGHPVQDVTLENIDITYEGGNSKTLAYASLDSLAAVPERTPNYPEFSMFGELPAYGFYVRHAQGLTLKNVRVSLNGADYRPAFVFDDVQKLALQQVTVPKSPVQPTIVLHDVPGPIFKQVSVPGDKPQAILVRGQQKQVAP
ncbi:glycoside hydrolase family 28 protein [Hymenobacter jejuensis]|uniref:Glycoside hydrolase family 28 n=1 Tax=Hymenobacter jejuensis TaxID=2502781 RepID=A0A5B8A4R5_9BACT|nr:glycosyl hydrolase family 28 protein [Hymenobacter jejuensis]QDA61633.1 glycoside hydrolase family 28 [Hymenobacter jejuensis]